MTSKRTHLWRFMLVAVVFCLACVIYLGRLFYIQISGRDDRYAGETTTRTVTIQAVRGEIYDRNGTALVSNRYTYDLALVYGSFSALDTRTENDTLLSILEALNCSGDVDKHEQKYFPFDGAYPYYSLSEEATDADSIPYFRLRRVLGDVGLKESSTVDDVIDYYVETYSLLATGSDGRRLYDDDEIDRLIRLRYDMDARRFGVANDYAFADEVSLSLMAYVKELNLGGIAFTVNVERVYNFPGYASHILGTVGPIYSEEWNYYNEQGYQMNAIVGKTGCEYAFEEYLHGSDGKLLIEEDAQGNIVRTEVLVAPIAGNDVHLTVDIELQVAAEDALAENVAYVVDRSGGVISYGANCNAGATVVMDPNTFSVLAIASYPTYDLATYNLNYNALAVDAAKPLLNRALNGLYEPGSTYKLGVATAALMEEQIEAASRITCDGAYDRFGSYRPKCSTYPHDHSAINVIEAIADSCNVFFYELGYRLGIDRLNDYMRSFGFGQSTGIEIGGATGILAGPDYRQQIHGEIWTDGMTVQAAIGQADNQASPLQLACYLSTLVRGGDRYAAHLLDSVYAFGSDTPSYTYTQSSDTLLSQVALSDEVLASVFEGMRSVVESNDVVRRNMQSVPVTVGGKTGTAQNSSGCDNALFVCAAPYDNPEIVISVVLEQGYAGSYSSLTAARILEKYYNVK